VVQFWKETLVCVNKEGNQLKKSMTENVKDQVLILDLTKNEIESVYLKGVVICWKQIEGFERNGFTGINN